MRPLSAGYVEELEPPPGGGPMISSRDLSEEAERRVILGGLCPQHLRADKFLQRKRTSELAQNFLPL
jgi:hypothetical protein